MSFRVEFLHEVGNSSGARVRRRTIARARDGAKGGALLRALRVAYFRCVSCSCVRLPVPLYRSVTVTDTCTLRTRVREGLWANLGPQAQRDTTASERERAKRVTAWFETVGTETVPDWFPLGAGQLLTGMAPDASMTAGSDSLSLPLQPLRWRLAGGAGAAQSAMLSQGINYTITDRSAVVKSKWFQNRGLWQAPKSTDDGRIQKLESH